DASDFARFYDTNLAFHDTYLNLSDNAELVRQVHLLKQRLYDFPRLKGFVPEWERASAEEHEAMVRCLEQGNGGAAADLLRDVHRARPLPLSAVRLTGGPLKQAQELVRQYLLALEPDRMLAYYRQRAGLAPKAEPYGGWDGGGRNLTGHIAGHYLSAISLMW